MNLVDFGPVKPSIQRYKNGYSVPVALTQVERPGIEDGTVEHSWQGYLLEVAALTPLELDTAIAALPAGDYSADRLAALQHGVTLERRASYPPQEELLYAIAEDNAEAIAAYKTKCSDACKMFPLYWDPAKTYQPGDMVRHDGKSYCKAADGDNSEPDAVPGGWDLA